MQDNLRYLQKEIDKNRIDANATRTQAQAERFKAGQGNEEFHNQQAQLLETRAQELEESVEAMEAKKTELDARVNELHAERDTINREASEKTAAIDKELEQLTGSFFG